MTPSYRVLCAGLALLWGSEGCSAMPLLQNILLASGGIGCGIALAQVWVFPGRKPWDTALCLAAMVSLIWHWWVWGIVLPAIGIARLAPRGRRRQARLWMIYAAPAVAAWGVWMAVPGILDGSLEDGWMLFLCLGIGGSFLLAAGKALRGKMIFWTAAGLLLAGVPVLFTAWYVWGRSGFWLLAIPVIALVLWKNRERFQGRSFRRYGFWTISLPVLAAMLFTAIDLRRFGSYDTSLKFLTDAEKDAAPLLLPVKEWHRTYGKWPSAGDLQQILPPGAMTASFVSDGCFYLEVQAKLHRPPVYYRFSADPERFSEGLIIWTQRFPVCGLRVPVKYFYPDREFRTLQ